MFALKPFKMNSTTCSCTCCMCCIIHYQVTMVITLDLLLCVHIQLSVGTKFSTSLERGTDRVHVPVYSNIVGKVQVLPSDSDAFRIGRKIEFYVRLN
jgi:hypothetical protein